MMKKFVFTLTLLVFSISSVVAQCHSKKVKKDSFVLNDNLIEATLYHDNGLIAQTGFYTLANKLHGEWVSYDQEGVKTATGSYDNGEKVGTWMFYQGDERKEVTYTDSKIAEVKTWKVSDTRVVTN